MLITIAIGVAGGLLGGFLGTRLGIGTVTGFNLVSLGLAIGGAVILLFGYRLEKADRCPSRGFPPAPARNHFFPAAIPRAAAAHAFRIMRRHLRRSRRKLFSPLAWRVRLVFWLGAVVVGLVCALFAVLAEQANHGFAALAHRYPLAPIALTPLGLVLIAWLTRRIFPGAQGSGIPQAIAALELTGKSTVLSLRIAVGKILLTVLGLFCGASIGREGPSVHVGSAIMYSLGALARFPAHYMERGLILAGGAAGIAAAFNTPLAGIVFAIEEMSRSFKNRTSGIVTIVVVIAGVTALAMHGHYFYFGESHALMPTLEAWLAILICGTAGAYWAGSSASC